MMHLSTCIDGTFIILLIVKTFLISALLTYLALHEWLFKYNGQQFLHLELENVL